MIGTMARRRDHLQAMSRGRNRLPDRPAGEWVGLIPHRLA
jgi:hypothetical protein